jgi:tetratricopeptide (TPR) repeat protein
MRYEDAANEMLGFVEATKRLQGREIDLKRASAFGMAGTYLLHGGRAAAALAPLRQSLQLCMALQNKEATSAYLQQLYNTHRYLGQPHEAAECADRLVEIHAGTFDEGSWRIRAALVRGGEPLVRVMVVQENRLYELEEVTAIKGAVDFAYERNRPNLDVPRYLVAQGEKLVMEGKYGEALGLFERAAGVDPYDPDPHYKGAMALVLQQHYAEAVQEYETALALAPGWFTADSDLWIAQELLAGRFSHEAFLVLWAVEYSQLGPAERLALIEQVLPQFPQIPQLHFYRGATLARVDRREEALAAFDEGLAQDPEPGIRSRILGQRAVYTPPEGQRVLFQEILDLPHANLLARATAQIMIYRTPE